MDDAERLRQLQEYAAGKNPEEALVGVVRSAADQMASDVRSAALEADITMCRHLLRENIRKVEDALAAIERFLAPAATPEAPTQGDVLAAAARCDRPLDAYGRQP